MNATGVDLGQTDMPLSVARSLLPPHMVLGASVNSVQEAKVVVGEAIADYIGIGPVWDTSTKKLEHGKTIVGVRGVGPILDVLQGTRIKSVVIGTYHKPGVSS